MPSRDAKLYIGGIRYAIPAGGLPGRAMSIQLVCNPMAGIENSHSGLQEGKIIHLENQETKFDQFKCSFP